MAEWQIKATETFLSALKKHKKDAELLRELESKIQRLKIDPYSVGGKLSGKLHGYQSTRLVHTFRLIFSIDETTESVYLEAIHHRKDAY